ncbi:MAG: metalloregulator ArsR/SmtB family transcription factor [Candidatus Omnitrophica bacterium]|nr:metalloregulator ArsR/SmtB family transcription factor [Candidatus Omnitrophota bacterium]
MRIKKARQILKTLADDTRLRIINLLKYGAIPVGEICEILEKEQSNVSKHLGRLRLTGIVEDKRRGNSVLYRLAKPSNLAHKELITAIVKGLSDIEVFKEDVKTLKKKRGAKTRRKKK